MMTRATLKRQLLRIKKAKRRARCFLRDEERASALHMLGIGEAFLKYALKEGALRDPVKLLLTKEPYSTCCVCGVAERRRHE